MDRSRFDVLTKLFAAHRTRRAALAAVLGAVVVGTGGSPTLTESKSKHKSGHGRKKRRHRSDGQSDENPASGTCYPGTNCFPVRGGTHSGCDFSNSTVFVGLDAQGAVLDGTNFSGANTTGADFRGAVLTGACFVGANLIDARIDISTLLDGAIFCDTIMPNGSVNNAGCQRSTTCCPATSQAPGSGSGCLPNNRTCTRNGDCCSNFCNPARLCRNANENCRGLNELCGAFAGPCCSDEGTVCTGGILSRCAAPCRNDEECRQKFPQYDTGDQFVVCVSSGVCGDSTCCVRACPLHPELCPF